MRTRAGTHAASLLEVVARRTADFSETNQRRPCLATVLVGDDPASHTYVRMKRNRSATVGMDSRDVELPAATTSTVELVAEIKALSEDPTVDGILLQHPVPGNKKRQIRQFMDFVLVREDYKFAKPHPEPYLTGLKRFGATREEALVVEDSSRGLNSAVAAGIDCAIVYNDFTRAQDFSQAAYRIENLADLRDIVLM